MDTTKDVGSTKSPPLWMASLAPAMNPAKFDYFFWNSSEGFLSFNAICMHSQQGNGNTRIHSSI